MVSEKRKFITWLIAISLALIVIYTVVYFGAVYFVNPVENIKNANLPIPTFFQITNIKNPVQIIWENEQNLLFTLPIDIKPTNESTAGFETVNTTLLRYNVKTRESEKLGTINDASHIAIGVENGQLFLCKWENFEITSIEQTATEIKVYSMAISSITEKLLQNQSSYMLMQTLKLSKTVKPINCNTNTIYLTTSLPILEEHFYVLNLETREQDAGDKSISDLEILKSEKDTKKYELTGTNMLTIKDDSHILFEIEKYNNIIDFYVSPDEKSVVLISEQGDLFIYTNGTTL